jgi:hypothetical protein
VPPLPWKNGHLHHAYFFATFASYVNILSMWSDWFGPCLWEKYIKKENISLQFPKCLHTNTSPCTSDVNQDM